MREMMPSIREAIGWLPNQLSVGSLRETVGRDHVLLQYRVSTVTASRVGSLAERALTILRSRLNPLSVSSADRSRIHVSAAHRQIRPRVRVAKSQIADFEVSFRLEER